MLVMFLGILIACSLNGIWQFDTAPTRKYYFIASFLDSEVALTTFLVMSLPLTAAVAVYAREPWLRMLGAGAVPLAVACQLLTFSRAGMLALFAEAVVMAGMVRTRLITALAGVVLVVGLSGAGALLYIGDQNTLSFIPVKTKLSTYNLVSRFKAWELGFEKVQEHPFSGWAMGRICFNKFLSHNLIMMQQYRWRGDAQYFPGYYGRRRGSCRARVPLADVDYWANWTIPVPGHTRLHGKNLVVRTFPDGNRSVR